MAISKHQARAIIRKAVKRVPEGEEIRHLNIMPMMDIMTILLVAFLFQATQSNDAFAVGNVSLPASRSFDPPPEAAVTLTIAHSAILVEGQPVVAVKNGDVDPSQKKDGALGIAVPKLSRFLGSVRADNARIARDKGKNPSDTPELVVLADKATPYRLLFEVIVSARSEQAGYRRFRLIVIEPGSHQPGQQPG
jgi:biopolymer transport protein ExbD